MKVVVLKTESLPTWKWFISKQNFTPNTLCCWYHNQLITLWLSEKRRRREERQAYFAYRRNNIFPHEQLFVKLYCNKTLTINIKLEASIKDLLDKINEKSPEPVTLLQYGGKPLSNLSSTLRSYGIKYNATLIANTVRVKGGGKKSTGKIWNELLSLEIKVG